MSEVQAIVEAYFIPIQLVLAMVGMGATLSVRDFINVVTDKTGLLVGLALQLIAVPAFAAGFIAVFGLERGWAVGFLLIAVVPGGAFSNLLTYIGKGNAALSVSVTAVTTLACVFTIPALLHLLVSEYMPVDFQVPTGKIIRDILFFLLIPLVVGMAVLRVNATAAAPLAKWAIRGSLVFLGLVVVSSLTSGRIKIPEYGWGPPLMLILFGICLANLTPLVCRLARRYDDDSIALTIEVVVRNIAIALLLVRFFFPNDAAQGHVLYALLFYAGFGLIAGIPMALSGRKGRAPGFLLKPWPRPAIENDSPSPDAPPSGSPPPED